MIENLLKTVQPHLLDLKAYQGVDPLEVLAQQAGISIDRVIRLNGNENLYGPSPKVYQTLTEFKDYNLYPDPQQRALREALAGYVKTDMEQIVAGNGSDELIDLTLRLFCGSGDNVINLPPTFGMYSFSAHTYGIKVTSVEREEGFEIDVDKIKKAINCQTRMVFIASPNNPTGNLTPKSTLSTLLDLGLPVVVDETYMEFCGQTVMPLLKEYDNLIVLRTFSKWAGLAGLRVGFGIMSPELARIVLNMKPPYNINRAAEVAVLASLDDIELLNHHIQDVIIERDRLYSLLQTIPGIYPYSSQANFILCHTPEGCGQLISEGLARKGVFIRYFNTDRLKDFIRISVGLPHHTDTLIQTLQAVVKECIE